MTPEELAAKFWDSLERQRVELNVNLPGLRDPAQPFSTVHPTTHKMWTQAAQEILDAQKPRITHSRYNAATNGLEVTRSCCPSVRRMASGDEKTRHVERCPNKCPEDCNLTRGHE